MSVTSASRRHSLWRDRRACQRIPQISFQRIEPAQSEHLCKISKQPLPRGATLRVLVADPNQLGKRLFLAKVTTALSRYRMKNMRDLRLAYFQVTAAATRHMFIADARKAWWVLAEVRSRCMLKVL
jgi:hypothetical protein